jgi:hypothetical protein
MFGHLGVWKSNLCRIEQRREALKQDTPLLTFSLGHLLTGAGQVRLECLKMVKSPPAAPADTAPGVPKVGILHFKRGNGSFRNLQTMSRSAQMPTRCPD